MRPVDRNPLHRGFHAGNARVANLADLLKTIVKPDAKYLQWLTVPHASELGVMAVSEILFLQTDNKYTTIATRASTFLLTSSLKEMLGKLDPAVFWQIHRNTVVNISAIDTIATKKVSWQTPGDYFGSMKLLKVSESEDWSQGEWEPTIHRPPIVGL